MEKRLKMKAKNKETNERKDELDSVLVSDSSCVWVADFNTDHGSSVTRLGYF